MWHASELGRIARLLRPIDGAPLDLDAADLAVLEGGFDTIVIGDLLEHLRDPQRVLDALYDLSADGARIVCCVPNMAHLSVVQRLICGDISDDGNGPLDSTHLRFFSPASLFKLFLDTGWLPHLQDQYRFDLPPTPFTAKVIEATQGWATCWRRARACPSA